MKRKILSVILLAVFVIFSVSGCFYEVRTPPPPPKAEIRPVPPFDGAVWIRGHWQWRRGRWVWVPGHWQRPPRSDAIWVPGHWKKTPWGWKWIPGHWR